MTLVKFSNGSRTSSLQELEKTFGFPSLIQDVFDKFWSENESVNWMPSVNIRERAEDYKIDLAVPGMNKEVFRVEMEYNMLTVTGERKEEFGESNEKVTRQEFQYGSFRRSFSLPAEADADKIQAAYKDGILSLTIAKKEEARQKPKKQISVE